MTTPIDSQARRMNRLYRPQRRLYDLTRRFILPGRDELLSGIPVVADPAREAFTILELGCGTGRNLFWLRRRHPQARLCGVDISEEMLEVARGRQGSSGGRAQQGAGPLDQVAFVSGASVDLEKLHAVLAMAPFDAIFFSYSLAMMPDWRDALRCAFTLLRPEGSLHVVDFGGFQDWLPPARWAARWWLTRWHVRDVIGAVEVLRDEGRLRGATVAVRQLGGGYAFLARMGAGGLLTPEIGILP